jgi:DNA-binding PadR family transcriptional regulator
MNRDRNKSRQSDIKYSKSEKGKNTRKIYLEKTREHRKKVSQEYREKNKEHLKKKKQENIEKKKIERQTEEVNPKPAEKRPGKNTLDFILN